MALVADLALPRYAAPPLAEQRATLYIASDYPPFHAQSWPVLVPIPVGFHEVSEQEALAINKAVPTTLSFQLVGPPSDAASEAAALSTAEPDAAVVANRRPSRVPREPRAPRAPRPARTPRPSRIFAPERAPRKPRLARKPRPPRPPRPPRARRPKNYKTKERPGVCKGPSCNCWTPGGCVGDWYLDLLPQFKASGCYRGPCYDYAACVSDKCQYHPGCTINQIIQFWAERYRAVAVYVQPVLEPAIEVGRLALRALPAIGVLQAVGELAGEAPPAGIQLGCPPGWYWTSGITGCRCVPPGSGVRAASQAEVIACIGQAEWDRLVSIGGQGSTG